MNAIFRISVCAIFYLLGPTSGTAQTFDVPGQSGWQSPSVTTVPSQPGPVILLPQDPGGGSGKTRSIFLWQQGQTQPQARLQAQDPWLQQQQAIPQGNPLLVPNSHVPEAAPEGGDLFGASLTLVSARAPAREPLPDSSPGSGLIDLRQVQFRTPRLPPDVLAVVERAIAVQAVDVCRQITGGIFWPTDADCVVRANEAWAFKDGEYFVYVRKQLGPTLRFSVWVIGESSKLSGYFPTFRHKPTFESISFAVEYALDLDAQPFIIDHSKVAIHYSSDDALVALRDGSASVGELFDRSSSPGLNAVITRIREYVTYTIQHSGVSN